MTSKFWICGDGPPEPSIPILKRYNQATGTYDLDLSSEARTYFEALRVVTSYGNRLYLGGEKGGKGAVVTYNLDTGVWTDYSSYFNVNSVITAIVYNGSFFLVGARYEPKTLFQWDGGTTVTDITADLISGSGEANARVYDIAWSSDLSIFLVIVRAQKACWGDPTVGWTVCALPADAKYPDHCDTITGLNYFLVGSSNEAGGSSRIYKIFSPISSQLIPQACLDRWGTDYVCCRNKDYMLVCNSYDTPPILSYDGTTATCLTDITGMSEANCCCADNDYALVAGTKPGVYPRILFWNIATGPSGAIDIGPGWSTLSGAHPDDSCPEGDWLGTSSLKSGFEVGQRSEDLPAEFTIRRASSQDLRAGFFTYNYITVLSREAAYFDGYSDFQAYLYRMRAFPGPLTLKSEIIIHSGGDPNSGVYFMSLTDNPAPINTMLFNNTNSIIGLAVSYDGVNYAMIGVADEPGGPPDMTAPILIAPDIPFYVELIRDPGNTVTINVYSDVEFSILVGSSAFAMPHPNAYSVLYAFDGGGFTGAPPPFFRCKSRINKLRVVI